MIMKGQAALEFLMTYGWAILIVIAVVAALYAMGVFNLPRGGLGKCSPCFPPGSAIAYVDHSVDTLVLRVGPEDIQDVSVFIGGDRVAENKTYPSGLSYFPSGSTIILSAPPSNFSGDVQITVQYRSYTSGLLHNVTATLHGAGV
jgi:hypothetical protein